MKSEGHGVSMRSGRAKIQSFWVQLQPQLTPGVLVKQPSWRSFSTADNG